MFVVALQDNSRDIKLTWGNRSVVIGKARQSAQCQKGKAIVGINRELHRRQDISLLEVGSFDQQC